MLWIFIVYFIILIALGEWDLNGKAILVDIKSDYN
jgi:hypothetical protein